MGGAQLGNNVVEVDAYTQKTLDGSTKGTRGAKGDGYKGGALLQAVRSVYKTAFQKGDGKGKGKRKGMKDPSKLVWIGEVPKGTEYPELLELGKSAGKAKWAEVLGKDQTQGVIGFAAAEDAANAVAQLNGASLGGATIVADAWEKKSK